MNGVGGMTSTTTGSTGSTPDVDVVEIARKLKALPDDQLIEKIDDVVKNYLERFKQELVGENEDLLPRLARTHRSKLVRNAWKASQKWCKWSEDGPVLMPDYTRIYYRRGSTEVLLQEFPPQTRLLRFQDSLISRRGTSFQFSERGSQSFSLGLPYTVFIFVFSNGMFNRVQCAFCDRPLKRLDEQPLRPYFTNIDTDLKVCLGNDLNMSKLEKDNISQQVAYILDHFWQSVFSDEWGTHFWQTRAHFVDSDPRLATLPAWEAATEEDPLFVVDNVDWLKHGDDNFGDLIVRNFEIGSKEDIQFQEELYKDIMDGLLEETKKAVENGANNVSEAISKMSVAKEIERQL